MSAPVHAGTRRARLLALASACVIFAVAPVLLPTFAIAAASSELCESLARKQFNNVTITTAELNTSTRFTPVERGKTLPVMADLPSFCRVRGIARPVPGSEIGFEVWLPESRWTNRLHMLGNASYSSNIYWEQMADRIRRGDVAVATDTGHTGGGSEMLFVVERPESLVDFSHRAVHETVVTAKAIVAAFYSAPAKYSYFTGCSTGGYQGLSEAQRYPDDFDGIIAGAPGNNRARLNLAFMWNYAANHRADNSQIVPVTKLPMLTRAAIAACDKIDGVVDGVINDPRECTFDPAQIECRNGDGENCLTPEQVVTIRKIYAGPRDARTGAQIYPGLTFGSEGIQVDAAELPGWGQFWNNPDQPDEPQRLDFFRYWVFKAPKWDWRKFDWSADIAAMDARISATFDANRTDLSRFKARRGKLLMFMGWQDPVGAAPEAINYYEGVVARSAADTPAARHTDTQSFLRLYMIPGMAHCRLGPGATFFSTQMRRSLPPVEDARHDMVRALHQWVERGTPPETLIATNFDNPDSPDRKIAFQRPICVYPQRARYKGGPQNSAASFRCEADDAAVSPAPKSSATLILKNADIWTVDERKPTARALAISGNRIIKVGDDSDVLKLAGPETQVLDMNGAFVLPGFTDSHTHFGNAVAAFYDVRLVDVNAEPLLLERLREKVSEVPKGMWITGYDWGSAAAAQAKRGSDAGFTAFTPSLAEVDRITPDHPVLLRRYDGVHFINSLGLRLARVDKHTPNPTHGEYVKDPLTGELTGMLLGSAGSRLALIMPPRSRARDLIGGRAMLRELNSHGITSIQDIARVDEISQTHIWHTDIERSTTDLGLFKDLRARGELSVRVYPILTLASWRDYQAHGITPGGGDDLIRYGTLKQFVDGSVFMSRPYDSHPETAGGFTFRVLDAKAIHDDVVGADALGFDTAAHVTGDRAHQLFLDWSEDASKTNPARDRRFRLIHAWYPSRAEVERAGRMHVIADIQPWQLIGEMPDMVAKLGPERAAFGFPLRTLMEKGVRITLGSDWPGSFDRSYLAPLDPMENIYYAVTRQRLDGTPAGGWHAEQRMTVDEAIRAYTLNGAFASRQEDVKGSLTEGKLADVVVLSKNLRKIAPREIPGVRVRYTIVDGRIVYASEQRRGAGEDEDVT